MQIILYIIGIALFTAGVAFIYWPAALICLGLLLVYAAWKGGIPDQPPPPTTR